MRRWILIGLLVSNFIISNAGPSGCGAAPLPLPTVEFTVGTLNMYVGFDITPFLDGSVDLNDPAAVAAAAQQIINEYEANEPETRLSAMADAIINSNIDIIGLQEALIWTRDGVIQDNFVDDLIELISQKGGGNYRSLTLTTFNETLPLGGSNTLTYVDREAIIFSGDVYCEAAAAGKIFDTARPPIIVLGQEVTFSRGAISAECLLPNGLFVYVFSTHLEGSDLPTVQEGQASELIDYITETIIFADLPVILLGDFNALESGGTTNTYSIITNDNFTDAYREKFPSSTDNPGYTCCQATDLTNATSQATSRFDYVLYRGDNISLSNSAIFANETVARQIGTGTIWPSEHFGVLGTFIMP